MTAEEPKVKDLPDGRYAVILPAGGRIVVRTRAEAEECAEAAKKGKR